MCAIAYFGIARASSFRKGHLVLGKGGGNIRDRCTIVLDKYSRFIREGRTIFVGVVLLCKSAKMF